MKFLPKGIIRKFDRRMKRTNKELLALLVREINRHYLLNDTSRTKEVILDDLSTRCGVTSRSLQDYVNGKLPESPRVNTLNSIAQVLGYEDIQNFDEEYRQELSDDNEFLPNKSLIEDWKRTWTIVSRSIEFNIEHFKCDQALVVPFTYAAAKTYWKDWAFCEAIIDKPLHIQKIDKKYRLNIDIDDSSLAIYNNAGKKFLYEFYKKSPADQQDDQRQIENLNRFLQGDDRTEYFLKVAPFRWSSGGVLPIVGFRPPGTLKKSQWVLLYWRDIHPIGWTIPLGGSHGQVELKNLTKLIFREFSEEVLVIDRHPRFGKVFQKLFIHRDREDNEYISPEFMKTQRLLRLEHDRLEIEVAHEGQSIDIDTVRSNMEVMVNGKSTRSVILSFNPKEMGIEAVKVVEFDIEEDDYILDGEYSENESPYLIRRPVMMVELERLIEKVNEAVGNNAINDSDCLELGQIPESAIHKFDYEDTLRSRRIDSVMSESEKNFLGSWATKKSEHSERNIILGPVVWKTIHWISSDAQN